MYMQTHMFTMGLQLAVKLMRILYVIHQATLLSSCFCFRPMSQPTVRNQEVCSDVFLLTWSFFFSDSDHSKLTVGVKTPLENPSKGSSGSLAALKVHMMLASVFASKIAGR